MNNKIIRIFKGIIEHVLIIFYSIKFFIYANNNFTIWHFTGNSRNNMIQGGASWGEPMDIYDIINEFLIIYLINIVFTIINFIIFKKSKARKSLYLALIQTFILTSTTIYLIYFFNK